MNIKACCCSFLWIKQVFTMPSISCVIFIGTPSACTRPFDVAPQMVEGRCNLIGRTLAKFTQLKRNKRFDNFIMLVGIQGSLFHIAAGSHPVQEAWGSQNSLYRGQIQKLLQCCQKPYQQIPLVITIQNQSANGAEAHVTFRESHYQTASIQCMPIHDICIL